MSSGGAVLGAVVRAVAGLFLATGACFDLSAGLEGIRASRGRATGRSTPPVGLVLYLSTWLAVLGAERSSGRTLVPTWVFLGLLALHVLSHSWAYAILLRRPRGG